ncbi:hypothetical protein CVV72_41250 (plasmid) [Amycolatopsis sp. TNS106]|nr:hypothetical protein CVV72_41250 [Amycolatopsis sp. TNS106]
MACRVERRADHALGVAGDVVQPVGDGGGQILSDGGLVLGEARDRRQGGGIVGALSQRRGRERGGR